MAFPSITASGTAHTLTTNGTSKSVNCPAFSAGDRLLLVAAWDGIPNISTISDVNGQSWVIRAGLAGNANACRLHVYEIANLTASGPSQTVTITLSISEMGAARIFAISGSHPTEVTAVSSNVTGLSTGPNPAALNPANWDIEDTLWLAVCAYDLGSVTVSGYPTNYTGSQQNHRSNNTNGAGFGLATRNNAVASEDPAAFTLSASEDWTAATLAIRPAPPATPVAKTFAVQYDVNELIAKTFAVQHDVGSIVPKVVGIAKTSRTTSGAFTLALPGGSPAAYVLLLDIQNFASVTPGSGWSLLYDDAPGDPAWVESRVYYAKASDSPSTSWSYSENAAVDALSAVVLGLDKEVVANATAHTNETQTTPTVTTTEPYALIVRALFSNIWNTASPSMTYPSGTENNDVNYVNGGGSNDHATVAVATSEQIATGATGTAAFSSTGSIYSPQAKTIAFVEAVSTTPVAKTFDIQYDVFAVVGKDFAVQYDLIGVVLKTFAVQHDIQALVLRTFAVQHDVRALVLRTFAVQHDVMALIKRDFAVQYDVIAHVIRSFAMPWDINAFVNKSFAMLWDYHLVVARTFAVQHDVRATVVKTFDMRFDVEGSANVVGNNFDILYDVRTLVGKTFESPWGVFTTILKAFGINWDLSSLALKEFELLWTTDSNLSIGVSVGSFRDNYLAFLQEKTAQPTITDITRLEWIYYTGLSGLTPAENYTIEDHKYKYFDDQVAQVSTDNSRQDLELRFLEVQTGQVGSYTDLAFLYYRPTP